MMTTPSGSRARSACRILVIAEDEQACGLLTSVLCADGHVVDAEADRTEAMTLIARHPYAAALSDLRMRGLDGPELVRVLSRRPSEEAAPALILLARPAFAPDLAGFIIKSGVPMLRWPAAPAEIRRAVMEALAA